MKSSTSALPAEALSRLKNDADRLLWASVRDKAKEAGMSGTTLLRELLRGYQDGRIKVQPPVTQPSEITVNQ